MLIVGNWKLFKGPAEAGAFCRALREVELPSDVDVVVCPPYVSLEASVQALAGTEVGVFAQNCHWELEGAFTGEISASMLQELGVYGTLVGHSERRQWFGETDETVARRVKTALEQGLHVIACVGESEAEREAGETDDVLRRQVGVLDADENLVIAYEPVWAIGTGRCASSQQVQEVHAFMRDKFAGLDATIASSLRLLYGGSVKPANAAELFGQPDVDGGLIGGASLVASDFLAICTAAQS